MTRIQFIKFLEDFKQDFSINNANWENKTLEDFLAAMVAYTRDLPGYYNNMVPNEDPDKPSWETFATILKGSAVYE